MDVDALGVDSQVWVAADGEGGAKEYYAGVVTSRDGPYVVVRSLLGKDSYNLEAEEQVVFRANRRVVADMTALQYFHLPGILHNVRERALAEEPYTFMGNSVLVAVNPLREVAAPEGALGSPQAIGQAHPYAIAEAAYQQMRFAVERPSYGEKVDQSIVVGGESGAGKTESSKMVLRHLVARSGKSGSKGGLDERLLETSPILEAFGNAATKRNANSSRFGKFIKMHFEAQSGAMHAASVETYLLERSRVTQHMLGERTFHVFHQLLEGSSDEMRDEFSLNRTFAYLRATTTAGAGRKRAKSMAKLDNLGEEDEARFHELCGALETCGVDKDGVLRVVAGILHLGNIKFDEKEGVTTDEAEVSTPESLEIAADLLALDPSELEQLLLERKVRAVGETIVTRRDAEAAKIAVDAVAKTIYVELFEYLVRRITEALAGEPEAEDEGAAFIGVLDIFGFETFRRNDFEQLLINYTNEALQETFNAQIFEAEAALYRSEGLLVEDGPPPQVGDNAAAMQLLAGVRGDPRAQPGILRLIENETQSPQPSDSKLNTAIHRTYGAADSPARASGAFVPVHPKDQKFCFAVRHYAGEVKYTTGHFIEKNVDRVPDEVTQVLGASRSGVLQEVFGRAAGPASALTRATLAGRALTKATTTVAGRFQASIEDLIGTLGDTRALFIRCVKPNSRMERGSGSDWFDAQYVIPQLYNLSIPQTAAVLKGGFPTRLPFADLVATYRALLPPEALRAAEVFCARDDRLFVKALFAAFGIPARDFKIGASRVFFRSGVLDELGAVLAAAARGALPAAAAGRFRAALVAARWRGVFAGLLAAAAFADVLRANRARESAVTILQRLAKRRAREARRRREEAARLEEEARAREEAARREAERLRAEEAARRAAREAAEAAGRRAEAERARQAELAAEERRRAEVARAAAEAAAAAELQKRVAAAEAAAEAAEKREADETRKAAEALGSEDALADKLNEERLHKAAAAIGENDEEDDDEETMTVRTRARSRAGSMVSHKTARQTIVDRARQEALLRAIPEDEVVADHEEVEVGDGDDDAAAAKQQHEGASVPRVFEDVRYATLAVKKPSANPFARIFSGRRRASIARVVAKGDSWERCAIIIRGYTLRFFESVRDANGPNPQGVKQLGEVVVDPSRTKMEVIEGADETEQLMKLTLRPYRGHPGREILFHLVEEEGDQSLLDAYQMAVKSFTREAKLAAQYMDGELENDHVQTEEMREAQRWLSEGIISYREYEVIIAQQITEDEEIFMAEAARYGEDEIDQTYRVQCEDCGEAVIFIKNYDDNPTMCPYCRSDLDVDEGDLEAESRAYRQMVDERLAHQAAMLKAHGGEGYPFRSKISSLQEMVVSAPELGTYYNPDEMRNVVVFNFGVTLYNHERSAIHIVEEFEFSPSWKSLRVLADRLANTGGKSKQKLSAKDAKKLPLFPEDPRRDQVSAADRQDAPTKRLREIISERQLLRVEEYVLELMMAARQIKTFYSLDVVRDFFNLPVDTKTLLYSANKVLNRDQLEVVATLADELFAQILQVDREEDQEVFIPPELKAAIRRVRPALEATADPTALKFYAAKKGLDDDDELNETSARAAQVLGVIIQCDAHLNSDAHMN